MNNIRKHTFNNLLRQIPFSFLLSLIDEGIIMKRERQQMTDIQYIPKREVL